MRILVTFAVEAEFAPWRKLRQFRETKPFLNSFMSKCGEADITVLLTGMGCKKSWMEAAKVIWDGNIDICISSGLAGALRSEHAVGEILVPERILASKSDRVVQCDHGLVETATIEGAKRVNGFYTADRVIVKAEEKQKLGAFADAVEMESGEILNEAAAFGARVVAIRAISDASNEDLPVDFNKVSSDKGDVSLRKIAGQALFSPASIPSLIRFGRQSGAAAETLAAFLERFLQTVAISPGVLSGVS